MPFIGVVTGPPRPTAGDDDDLICLILPELHQSILQNRDWGKGAEGRAQRDKALEATAIGVTGPTKPAGELVVHV